MVCVWNNAAHHDRTASQVGERASGDFDCRRAESGAAIVRVGIVADAKRDLAKLGESNVVKDHAGGRSDLHGRRLLAQFVTHRLERTAPPAAVTDGSSWISG